MHIDDSLIVRNIFSPDRDIRIVCQETTVQTIDQEILVWWKQGRHWKRTNEIGDGMDIVRVHQRKEITHEIITQWLLYGLSPRQEYDEDTNSVTTYLYKFPKDPATIDMTNELLGLLVPGVSIEIVGRFVVVRGGPEMLIDPIKLCEQLRAQGVTACLSFLQGLLLAYGDLTMEDHLLHNCVLHLPLTGPIAAWQELVQESLVQLSNIGIYTSQSLLTQRDGQLLQVTCADWEFLQYTAQWWKQIEPTLQVSKYQFYLEQRNDLLTFLSAEQDAQKMIGELEDSVLKMIRK